MAKDGEFKTTLKIEGDASGAKQATEETSASLDKLGKDTTDSAGKTTKANKDTADATEKTAKSFDDLAKKAGTSEGAFQSFREAVARVNPQLAEMLDLGSKAPAIFDFLRSSLGGWVIGISAAMAAAVISIRKVIAVLKEAQEEFRKAMDANERFRAMGREQQSEAEKATASAGLPYSASQQVRTRSQSLQELLGIDPAQASQIAAAFTGRGGELLVSEDEFQRFAAGAAAGLLEVKTPTNQRERERFPDIVRRRAARREQEIIDAYETQLAAQQRNAEDAIQGRETEIRRIAEQRGFQGEELDAEVQRITEEIKAGGKPIAINPKFPQSRPNVELDSLRFKFGEFTGEFERGVEKGEFSDTAQIILDREERLRETLEDVRRAQAEIERATQSPASQPVTNITNYGNMTYDSEALKRSTTVRERINFGD